MLKLALSALSKCLIGFLFVAGLLFWPAGTLQYPNAWLFLGVLFAPILLLGTVMLFKAPDLLKKRLNGKEKQGDQKAVVAVSALMFLAGFLVAGLDFRFAWSTVPSWITIVGMVLFLASYALYAEVMRENAYLSRRIEVQTGQTVVDTGLYGVIRHPMYAGTIVLFLSIPLILGSWIAFVIFLIYPVLIAVRIRGEEALLERELDGYTEYKQRVKYRLIPFLW